MRDMIGMKEGWVGAVIRYASRASAVRWTDVMILSRGINEQVSCTSDARPKPFSNPQALHCLSTTVHYDVVCLELGVNLWIHVMNYLWASLWLQTLSFFNNQTAPWTISKPLIALEAIWSLDALESGEYVSRLFFHPTSKVAAEMRAIVVVIASPTPHVICGQRGQVMFFFMQVLPGKPLLPLLTERQTWDCQRPVPGQHK